MTRALNLRRNFILDSFLSKILCYPFHPGFRQMEETDMASRLIQSRTHNARMNPEATNVVEAVFRHISATRSTMSSKSTACLY